MKVKMFRDTNITSIENEVNHFLKTHPVDIVHITQTDSEMRFILTIFYEEKVNLSEGDVRYVPNPNATI